MVRGHLKRKISASSYEYLGKYLCTCAGKLLAIGYADVTIKDVKSRRDLDCEAAERLRHRRCAQAEQNIAGC